MKTYKGRKIATNNQNKKFTGLESQAAKEVSQVVFQRLPISSALAAASRGVVLCVRLVW
jgi:hypothetical protein